MPKLFSTLALLFSTAALYAQSSAGGATIQGTVKDSSGLAIPGAKLTITHIDTGVATTTVSNSDGFFAIPPVQIGRYKIRCEHTAMKAWEQIVLLETGATLSLDPVLTPGAVNQTVTVSPKKLPSSPPPIPPTPPLSTAAASRKSPSTAAISTPLSARLLPSSNRSSTSMAAFAAAA